MDALALGLQAIEAAMQAGTTLVASIDQLAQNITVPSNDGDDVTVSCTLSNCMG